MMGGGRQMETKNPVSDCASYKLVNVANQKKKMISNIQSLCYLCTNTQLMKNKNEPEVLVQKCIYNFPDVTDS